MPSDRRERSGSAGSGRSAVSRASSSMGLDGGEAGRKMAAEDELIRRELQDPTAFCNSFWGMNDAGYPVIQSRMKSAQRVVDEVKAMYKERAEIEAEYSKRLAKLARQGMGKEETGSMRAALDVVRLELEQTAKTHADLSAQFRRDLEGQMAEFQYRVQQQRKDALTNIEKLYKQKSTQESYVAKSRDKYEQDCIRINGYTAQSSLVQGRDLEKVTSKLDKAQSTVNGNDKDYQNFVRALKDTTLRWNSEWKAYLDQCQDLEEERLEFLKSNLWNYANAISAMCVADDQSCERVRVSLEQCEAPRDIVDFIQRAGTSSAIPDPPEYINYARGQPPPPRPTFKQANFSRTTTRPPTFVAPMPPSQSTAPGQGLPPSASSRRDSHGGGGAGGFGQGSGFGDLGESQSVSDVARGVMTDPSQSGRMPLGSVQPSGMVNANPSASPTRAMANLPADDSAMDTSIRSNKSDKRMSAKNFLARTPSRSYSTRGAPSQSMPMQASGSAPQRLPASDTSNTAGTTIIKPLPSDETVGAEDDDDPIAKALANLRMKPGRSPAPQGHGQQGGEQAVQRGGMHSHGSVNRHSGGAALAHSPSSASHTPNRARSPSAAFMQEPEQTPQSPLPVEEVLGQYGQHFPGEKRSVSRQNSNASRHSRLSMQAPPAHNDRARSPAPGESANASGFAGVGARGRSPSPQPYQQTHGRPHQPSTHQPQQQQQRPPPQTHASGRPGASGAVPQRSTTPLGISLDASGSVTHDQMADDFIKRTGSVGPAQGRVMTPQNASTPSSVQPGYGQYAGHTQQFSSVSTPTGTPGPQQAYAYGQQAQYQQPGQHMYATPPPQQHVQRPPDAMNSIGRASQRSGGGGYQSPSPYNQRPASAAPPPQHPQTAYGQGHGMQAQQAPYAAPPAPQHQPPAANAYYGNQPGIGRPVQQQQQQQQDTPASAYMHQYQQQQHSQSPAPAPALQQHPQQHHQQPPPGHQPVHQYGGQHPSNTPTPSPQATAPVPIPAMNGYGGGGSAGYQPAAQQTVRPTAQPGQQVAAAPPTGQYSEAGKPILFYVKALYDYKAQVAEEFDFTSGDVIAVWETNPDGWWQGELLDDARRRRGANTFPSNFVSLLN